ncbi:MAG: cold shock domain-containing protein [Tepidisphaera sp.]
MDEVASKTASDRQVNEGRISQEVEPKSTPSPPVKPDLAEVEGAVKWFDPRKGFGFITGPEGQDIFAHFSIIEGDGFRVLKDGSRVIYDAVKTDKGWKALRVRRVEDPSVVVVARSPYSRTPRR